MPIQSKSIGTELVDIESQSSNLFCISLDKIKYKCFFVNLTENNTISMTLSHNMFFFNIIYLYYIHFFSECLFTCYIKI